MQTVAATIIDVAQEYQRRAAPLPIKFAFMLYDPNRRTALFTTFFEQVDHEAEDALARIEGYMLDSFSEYLFDFRTIHLAGRDLTQFLIPAGSIPLIRKQEPHRAAS